MRRHKNKNKNNKKKARKVFQVQGWKRRQANAHTDGEAHTLDAIGEVQSWSHS